MLTPYPWCLVNAPLKTKRWNIINTLHLSYIFILIFNKCHIVKISVKEPRSSGHQERGRHDQDHDDHSGPGGKAHRAVTVVTVTVAEIPNGLSLLINCQAPLQVHDHQSQDSISVMDNIEDEIQEDIQSKHKPFNPHTSYWCPVVHSSASKNPQSRTVTFLWSSVNLSKKSW